MPCIRLRKFLSLICKNFNHKWLLDLSKALSSPFNMVFLLYRDEGWMTLRFVKQNTGIKASARRRLQLLGGRQGHRNIRHQPEKPRHRCPPHLGSEAAKKTARSSPGWRRVCSRGEERARQLGCPAVPRPPRQGGWPGAPLSCLGRRALRLPPRSLKWWKLRLCLGATEYVFKQRAHWFWNRDDVPGNGTSLAQAARPLSLSVRSHSSPGPVLKRPRGAWRLHGLHLSTVPTVTPASFPEINLPWP